MPKVNCLVPPVQAVPTFLRPACRPLWGLSCLSGSWYPGILSKLSDIVESSFVSVKIKALHFVVLQMSVSLEMRSSANTELMLKCKIVKSLRFRGEPSEISMLIDCGASSKSDISEVKLISETLLRASDHSSSVMRLTPSLPSPPRPSSPEGAEGA